MTQVLNITQAKDRGMEPLTVAMRQDDPVLRRTFNDMSRIKNTVFALVKESKDRFAIWRVPAAGLEPYADGKQPRPRKHRKYKMMIGDEP